MSARPVHALLCLCACGRLEFAALSDAAPDDVIVFPDIVVQPGCGATSVGVGELHTCVVVENGATYCAGENTNGELGVGEVTANVDTPVLATRLAAAKSVYGGRGFTCMVDASDGVHCVGINANRQCGVASGGPVLDSVSPLGLPTITGLSLGYSNGCATTTAGDVYCWGDGDEGQPGDGTDPGSYTPAPVPSLVGSSATVSVGASHICTTIAGAVSCWADGRDLRLGVPGPDTCANASAGSIECAKTPSAVAVPPMRSVSAGEEHTCALTQSGQVWCWGSNDQGQVGAAKSPQEAPARIGTLDGIVDIVTGHDHTCVLDAAGVVQCWGDNIYLQLGAAGSDSVTPVAIALPEKVTSLHMGASAYHTCVILEGGSVWCWGRGGEGQLGRGPQAGSGLPAPMLLPCP